MLVSLVVTGESCGTVKFLSLRVPKVLPADMRIRLFCETRSSTFDDRRLCFKSFAFYPNRRRGGARVKSVARGGIALAIERYFGRGGRDCEVGAEDRYGLRAMSGEALPHACDFGAGCEEVCLDVACYICSVACVIRMGCEIFSGIQRFAPPVSRTPIFCKHRE